MYFVIYSSHVARQFTGEGLQELLIQSREKNKALAITGLLLHYDGKFMQLIEGEEKTVKDLYEVICKDERHKDVLKLKEGHIENRFFKDWSMGFKPFEYRKLSGLEGYKDMSKPNRSSKSYALQLYTILTDDLPFYVPY